MEEQMKGYEEAKHSARSKKTENKRKYDLDELGDGKLDSYGNSVEFSDVVQVGSKIIIGGGIGLLAGVATIAVAASAAEVVLAGVLTKVTGVVGGAMGLSLGLNKYKKDKKKTGI